jgi:hypothetical protein
LIAESNVSNDPIMDARLQYSDTGYGKAVPGIRMLKFFRLQKQELSASPNGACP